MGDFRSAKIGAASAQRAVATHTVARNLWEDIEWDGDFTAAVNELLDTDRPIQNKWRVYRDDA